MATLILPYPAFTAGTPAVAAEVQDNFTTIRDHINGQNIGTANLESTLVSRVGGPILFLNQASQEQIALSILNSRTKSALQITQSAVLGAGSSIIHIDDNATQTTGSANLFLDLQPLSTIPAILVKHGAVETMRLTKDQLDFNGSTVNFFTNGFQASASQLELFNSAIELSAAKIKLPIRTTAERDAVTQEGSILYNTTSKVVQYRDDTDWKDFTPTGIIHMFAGTSAPSGWLYCNGQAVSRTTYAKLFSVIGTTYGAGDGFATFNLPNFVGIFPRGSAMDGVTTQIISTVTYTGQALNTKQTDAIQNITGQFAIGNDRLDAFSRANFVSGAFAKSNVSSTGIQTGGATGQSDGLLTFNASRVVRTDTETRPANIAIAYIIKT